MGDSLKLSSKGIRHRSSSSLNGLADTSRSERKLDIRASIPEVDDQFMLAEERCELLQNQLDLVKSLKRKKKLKKRSTTGLSEVTLSNVITVTTQPKRRLQKPLPRCTDEVVAPRRVALGYFDPDTMHKIKWKVSKTSVKSLESKRRRSRQSGDYAVPADVLGASSSSHQQSAEPPPPPVNSSSHQQSAEPPLPPVNEVPKKKLKYRLKRLVRAKGGRSADENQGRPQAPPQAAAVPGDGVTVEAQVDVLSPRARDCPSTSTSADAQQEAASDENIENGDLRESNVSPTSGEAKHRSIAKHQTPHYEYPTVASQLKNVGVRDYHDYLTHSIMPFVPALSTGPSHNLAVGVQQVLHGVKNQQPVSRIPSTLAHNMGLRQIPPQPQHGVSTASTSSNPPVDSHEFNVLNIGGRVLRLPSRSVSFRRLFSMFRKDEGLISRFLGSMNRPQHFYQSMSDLLKKQRAQGATSISRRVDKTLELYNKLYEEYTEVEFRLITSPENAQLKRRRDMIMREFAAREKTIKRALVPNE